MWLKLKCIAMGGRVLINMDHASSVTEVDENQVEIEFQTPGATVLFQESLESIRQSLNAVEPLARNVVWDHTKHLVPPLAGPTGEIARDLQGTCAICGSAIFTYDSGCPNCSK